MLHHRLQRAKQFWNFPRLSVEYVMRTPDEPFNRAGPMAEFNQLSDEDLLRRMRSGEEEAFTAVYRRHQGRTYRFALQMSGSPALAEEVTQESFLAVISQPDGFDPTRGSLSSFLLGIARHQVLRRLDRDRIYVPLGEALEEVGGRRPAELAVAEDPVEQIARKDRIERTRRAILNLPRHYREAVVLCDLQELSYAEAAKVAGCAIGTLRSRLHRARALLLEKLTAVGETAAAGDSRGSARCLP